MAKWMALQRITLATALVLAATACGDSPTVTQAPLPAVPPTAATPEIIDNGTEVILDMDLQEKLGPEARTGGAIFTQSSFETSSGTGNVQPFLKTNTNLTVFNAFNTSGDKPATVTTNDFTRDLPLSWVPTVLIGNPPVLYREFRLDINEPNNATDFQLSLDRFEVWTSAAGLNENGTSTLPNTAGATKVYEFPTNVTTWMRMDATLSSGSGGGDVFFYIPETNFGQDGINCPYDGAVGTGCGRFVTLVVRFGEHVTQEGTFEEFGVRTLPYLTKTATYKYDEEVSWSISKKVKRSTDASFTGNSVDFDLWNGESATANYQVVVDKTVTKTNNRIEGVITIHNQTDGPFAVSNVTDTYEGTTVNVTCPANSVAKNSTLDCPYTINLQSAPTFSPPKFNTATATLTNANLTLQVQGKTLVNGPGVLGNTTGFQTVNVTDNFNSGGAVALGSASDDKTFTPQNRTFSCAADKGTKVNVATITETGQTANASVVTRCYALEVTKTATPAFARTYTWAIDKKVKKQGADDGTYAASQTYNMFVGDEGVVTYRVIATRTITDGSYNVSGNITVSNPAASSGPVTLQALTDAINNGGGSATIGACTLDGNAFTIPSAIPAGKSVICAYTKNGVSSNPGTTTFTNTANATGRITKVQTGGTDDEPFSGTKDFTFVGVTPTESGFATVDLTDSFDGGAAAPIAGATGTTGGTFTYDRTLSCGSTKTYNNTAKITQTLQTANASVVINCGNISVSKNATARSTRTWSWRLVKAADDAAAGQVQGTNLTVAIGESFTYYYKVTASANDPIDSDWGVGGTITVTNNASYAVPIASVVDTVTQGMVKTSCPVTGAPSSIAGSGNSKPTYDCGLDAGGTTSNTATARIQNKRYTGTGSTDIGTTPFTGGVAVNFPGTITRVNDCVNVYDDKQTPTLLGTVCAVDATRPFAYSLAPKTFNYSKALPAPQSCGQTTFTNTATTNFRLSDGTVAGAATDPSSITLTLNTPCPAGCTLTQGYWKTHNGSFGKDKKGGRKGPPIHDFTGSAGGLAWSAYDTWKFFFGTPTPVPSGNPAITPVASPPAGSTSWFEVWTTAPKGNPYYTAAHQFMAALMNVANSADGSAVNADLYSAYNFFLQYPANKAGTAWTPAQIDQLKAWNSKFAAYNEGSIGPGHCSEDNTSVQ